jgi:hypothetical protein
MFPVETGDIRVAAHPQPRSCGILQVVEPDPGTRIQCEHPMIDLYNNDTNQLIGSITEAELQVLVDRLEEESETDQDYYIDQATIDMLGDGTTTDHLLQTLRNALGSADGVEVRWQRR